MPQDHHHHHHDPRVIIYRMARQTLLIIAVVSAVKFLVIDIVPVKGDQMMPSIVHGDRVLAFRLPCLPLIRSFSSPARGSTVFFTVPFEKRLGCLRVAGVSGDTVTVSNGRLINSADSSLVIPLPDRSETDPLITPPDYSPRDFIPSMRVPGPGDLLNLDSLDIFRYFSAVAVIRQENPESAIKLIPTVILDGRSSGDYFISDFLLYNGAIGSVPDSLRYDWFFWNRLSGHIQEVNNGHTAAVAFTLTKDGIPVRQYRVKKRSMFLIADNWTGGLDSRYFGPVITDHAVARPICILWSHRTNGNKVEVRFGRFLKGIR